MAHFKFVKIKRSLENKGTAAQKSRQDGTILKNHLMREEQKTRVVVCLILLRKFMSC